MAGVVTRENASNASNGDATDDTRRITRSSTKKQTDTTTDNGTNGTPGFEAAGGEDRGTTLDEVAWLIANLKMIITQQGNVIESLRAEMKEMKKEMKEEQQALKTELETVKNQTKQVQEQLDALTKSQALNIPTNNSPKVSYADTARTPPLSQPSNVR